MKVHVLLKDTYFDNSDYITSIVDIYAVESEAYRAYRDATNLNEEQNDDENNDVNFYVETYDVIE